MIEIKISISTSDPDGHLSAILARDINGQWVGFGPILTGDDPDELIERVRRVATEKLDGLVTTLSCGCSRGPQRLMVGCETARLLLVDHNHAERAWLRAVANNEDWAPEALLASKAAYTPFERHFVG